jgi:hypothetical protein
MPGISQGDRVFVWKWVWDREYSAEGIVTKVHADPATGCELLYVEGDWYVNANDETHKCKIVK